MPDPIYGPTETIANNLAVFDRENILKDSGVCIITVDGHLIDPLSHIFDVTAYIDTIVTSNHLLEFQNTDIEITSITCGLILKSSNGTRWRLQPTDNGDSQWTQL